MNARFSKIKRDKKARRSKDEVVLLTTFIMDRFPMHIYNNNVYLKDTEQLDQHHQTYGGSLFDLCHK